MNAANRATLHGNPHAGAAPVWTVDFAHILPDPLMLRAFFRSAATFRGYWEHFAGNLPAAMGVPEEAYLSRLNSHSSIDFADWIADTLSARFDLREYVEAMQSAGVAHALVAAGDEHLDGRSLLGQISDWQAATGGWLVGGLGVAAADGARAEWLVDRAVREFGLRFVVASPFRDSSRITDGHWAPILRACEKHDLPFMVHVGQFWLTDRPYDLEHPRYIDAIAREYPRLRIIAAHAGWPWIPDMVAIAWKHRNVWIDTSAHRPRSFPRLGSGFEMLYGRLFGAFMDRMLFGSAAPIIGTTVQAMREDVLGLEIPEEAKIRWLGGNAREFFPDLLASEQGR